MYTVALRRSTPQVSLKAQTSSTLRRAYASNKLVTVIHKELEQIAQQKGISFQTTVISNIDVANAKQEKLERDLSHFKVGYEKPFLKAWSVLQEANTPFSGKKMVNLVPREEKEAAFQRYGAPELLFNGRKNEPSSTVGIDSNDVIQDENNSNVFDLSLRPWEWEEWDAEGAELEDINLQTIKEPPVKIRVDDDNQEEEGDEKGEWEDRLSLASLMQEEGFRVTLKPVEKSAVDGMIDSSVYERAKQCYVVPPMDFPMNLDSELDVLTPYNKPIINGSDDVIMAPFYGIINKEMSTLQKQRDATMPDETDHVGIGLRHYPEEEENFKSPFYVTKKEQIPMWSMTLEHMADPRHQLPDIRNLDVIFEPPLTAEGELYSNATSQIREEAAEGIGMDAEDPEYYKLRPGLKNVYEINDVEEDENMIDSKDETPFEPPRERESDNYDWATFLQYGNELAINQSKMTEKDLHKSIIKEILDNGMIPSPMTEESIVITPTPSRKFKRNQKRKDVLDDEYLDHLKETENIPIPATERFHGANHPMTYKKKAKKPPHVGLGAGGGPVRPNSLNIYWALPRATSEETKINGEFPFSLIEKHEMQLWGSHHQRHRVRKVLLKVKPSLFRFSEPAMERFRDITKERYNEEEDVLTLPVSRFMKREDNVFFAKRLLRAIVDEAWKADPSYVSLDVLVEKTLFPGLDEIFRNPTKKVSLLHYTDVEQQ
ncbi:hypothetical protein PROFUN_04789 [Planoprotostelium fungivorum]|uniref:Small ribosomal subunit protein mS35 mitochondrial conserved domain-containing protein n=1 Tax=Planoprotostelium fungivorum TaxID=1890364 RepID=A0A2P6NSV6_9EUKA|nr:hypothetical protein PROFUN_04789 [Planoprotostelium fungivorum]